MVAATVAKPASSRTGNGSDEPEPEPVEDRFPNSVAVTMAREYMGELQ